MQEADLKLELHAADRVARFDARQPLYVTEEVTRRDLGVARLYGFDQ